MALQGLGLGVAVDYGRQEGGHAARSTATQGQATLLPVRDAAPTLAGEPRPLVAAGRTGTGARSALLGEYVQHVAPDVDAAIGRRRSSFDNDAWQVALSYVLTGENASYQGVVPREDFAPGEGGWGAWEVAARYHELDLDDDAFDDAASRTRPSRASDAQGVGASASTGT